MDAFIASAKDLMATADEAGRKKILDTLRDVSYSLENTQESAQRILFLVSCTIMLSNSTTNTKDDIYSICNSLLSELAAI